MKYKIGEWWKASNVFVLGSGNHFTNARTTLFICLQVDQGLGFSSRAPRTPYAPLPTINALCRTMAEQWHISASRHVTLHVIINIWNVLSAHLIKLNARTIVEWRTYGVLWEHGKQIEKKEEKKQNLSAVEYKQRATDKQTAKWIPGNVMQVWVSEYLPNDVATAKSIWIYVLFDASPFNGTHAHCTNIHIQHIHTYMTCNLITTYL